MKFKKIFTLLMVIATTVAMTVGCGKKEEPQVINEKKLRFTCECNQGGKTYKVGDVLEQGTVDYDILKVFCKLS